MFKGRNLNYCEVVSLGDDGGLSSCLIHCPSKYVPTSSRANFPTDVLKAARIGQGDKFIWYHSERGMSARDIKLDNWSDELLRLDGDGND